MRLLLPFSYVPFNPRLSRLEMDLLLPSLYGHARVDRDCDGFGTQLP